MSFSTPQGRSATNPRHGALLANGQITPPDTPIVGQSEFGFARSITTVDTPCSSVRSTQSGNTALATPYSPIRPVGTAASTLPQPRSFSSDDPFAELVIGRRFADGQWSVVHEAYIGTLEELAGPALTSQSVRDPKAKPGGLFAVKVARGKRAVDALMHEARILSRLSAHPNGSRHTVGFNGWAVRQNALVLELASSTLDDYIGELGQLSAATREAAIRSDFLPMAVNLIAGLRWMHDAGVVHGDIKPGNILLRAPSREAVYCDFTAARLDDVGTPPPSHGGGTYDFMAPELFGLRGPGNWPTRASDVWALAVTMIWVVIGGSPFAGAANVYARRAMASGGLVREGICMSAIWQTRMDDVKAWEWVEGALEKKAGARWSVADWEQKATILLG